MPRKGIRAGVRANGFMGHEERRGENDEDNHPKNRQKMDGKGKEKATQWIKI